MCEKKISYPFKSKKNFCNIWNIKYLCQHFRGSAGCQLDCISNVYRLDIKKVILTLDYEDLESTQAYISFKTQTEVMETLTGKVKIEKLFESYPLLQQKLFAVHCGHNCCYWWNLGALLWFINFKCGGVNY